LAIDGFSHPPVAWQYKQGKFSFVILSSSYISLLSVYFLHFRQKVIGVYVFLGVQKVDSVNQKTFRDYEIYIHPEWNSTTQAGNVALIKLSTVVEYTRKGPY
jgi:hypothetical protein